MRTTILACLIALMGARSHRGWGMGPFHFGHWWSTSSFDRLCNRNCDDILRPRHGWPRPSPAPVS